MGLSPGQRQRARSSQTAPAPAGLGERGGPRKQVLGGVRPKSVPFPHPAPPHHPALPCSRFRSHMSCFLETPVQLRSRARGWRRTTPLSMVASVTSSGSGPFEATDACRSTCWPQGGDRDLSPQLTVSGNLQSPSRFTPALSWSIPNRKGGEQEAPGPRPRTLRLGFNSITNWM